MNLTTGIAAPQRQVNLISVCGGLVYVGQLEPFVTNVLAGGQGGGPLLSPAAIPSIAFIDNKAYLVDGVGFFVLDLTTNNLSAFTATAGSLPPPCAWCCTWRGSLIFGGELGNPQNSYLSRIGSYGDFDYSAAATDPARPISLNSGSGFGKIGDPVVAGIPLNDDILLFACDHQFYAFVGDPRYQGVVDHFIHDIGILGPNAWCFDPVGTLYWIETSGLYRLPKGGTIPEPISLNVISDYFQGLDKRANLYSLCWDQDRHGLWIFATPEVAATNVPGVHLFWDARTGGFFPQRFPNFCGPTSAIIYDATSSVNRRLVLGGRDGAIRQYSDVYTSDDGNTISSFVDLGPVRLIDDLTEGKVIALDLYTGMDAGGPLNLDYAVQGAKDPFNALNNPDNFALNTVTTQGHTKDRQMRVRGGSIVVNLSNNTLNAGWSLEKVVLTVVPGARQR